MKVTGKPPYLLKVQDGRYDYIETGSLISIRKNTQFITIPSEEKAIQMKPMDFEEFKWALGDTESIPLLRIFWEKKTSSERGTQDCLSRWYSGTRITRKTPYMTNCLMTSYQQTLDMYMKT